MRRRNFFAGLVGLAVAGTVGKVFGRIRPQDGFTVSFVYHKQVAGTFVDVPQWGNPVHRIWFDQDRTLVGHWYAYESPTPGVKRRGECYLKAPLEAQRQNVLVKLRTALAKAINGA